MKGSNEYQMRQSFWVLQPCFDPIKSFLLGEMVVFEVHQACTISFTSTPSDSDHGIHSLVPYKGMFKVQAQELTFFFHRLVRKLFCQHLDFLCLSFHH
jgi:hypothetical protein